MPYLPYILPVPLACDWIRRGLSWFLGCNAEGCACFVRGMLQHGFHVIWGFSHAGCYGYDRICPSGCHGKQMKILDRPTCDSIARWQQTASRYFRVVRSQCTIGGTRAWFVRKVAPVSRLSARRINTTFLAFSDLRLVLLSRVPVWLPSHSCIV